MYSFLRSLVLSLAVPLLPTAILGQPQLERAPVALPALTHSPRFEEFVLWRPADAPTSLKVADFRFNAPAIAETRVHRDENRRVMMALSIPDDPRIRNVFTAYSEDERVAFHDDGRSPDAQAGDRVFTAYVDLDFEALRLTHARRLALLAQQERPIISLFEGRSRTFKTVDLSVLQELFDKGIIIVLPGEFPSTDPKKTLVITDLDVVEDPLRTFDPCTNAGTPMGKWTFGYLMQQIANEPVTGINASDLTLAWLQTWATDQSINGFTVKSRVGISSVISQWPKLPGGRLDLGRAPMRLLAIVNRIDMATNTAYGPGSGGEGRMVFGLSMPDQCSPHSFTIIFEYGIPKHTCEAIRAWANKWKALDGLPLGSATYNSELEKITNVFTAANAAPSRPNGSALNQIRTNELQLNTAPWEFREFRLAASGINKGKLRPVTVKQTPDTETYQGLFGEPDHANLSKWINDNEAVILAGTYTAPDQLPAPASKPFLGGSSLNKLTMWNPTGVINPEARFQFAFNTCNGCHSGETGGLFFHILPNGNDEAKLSGFLKGDGLGGDLEVTREGLTHRFHDLDRRGIILDDLADKTCLQNLSMKPVLMTH